MSDNGQRVPPHSLEMEECLLGSMLLSRDAIVRALDVVTSADFYQPDHAVIFASIATLYRADRPVDPSTVCAELQRTGNAQAVGGKPALLRLQAGTPASRNAGHYAEVVNRFGVLRRAIGVGGEIAEAAYDSPDDPADVIAAGRSALDDLEAGLGVDGVDPGRTVREILAMPRDTTRRWVIPDVLAIHEVAGFTGSGGVGKATLFRQIAVQLASGIHPFTWEPIPPKRSLIVDCQESNEELQDDLARLVEVAGHRFDDSLVMIKERFGGMNLARPHDQRWLDALCALHNPDLLLMGPLYAMYQGSDNAPKHSEEATEPVVSALMQIRARHDCAVMIEAHGTHTEGRIRGSALWGNWLAFGWEMVPKGKNQWSLGDPRDVALRNWRFGRVRGRKWPTRLVHGEPHEWMWRPPNMEAVHQGEVF